MNQEQLWEIEKYVAQEGICPFDEWFETLDSQFQARIDTRFDRVSLGNFGDTKNLGGGIYELRFSFGAGYRVYYGIRGRRVILLLTGGSKNSQNKDIRLAKELWNAYKKESRGE